MVLDCSFGSTEDLDMLVFVQFVKFFSKIGRSLDAENLTLFVNDVLDRRRESRSEISEVTAKYWPESSGMAIVRVVCENDSPLRIESDFLEWCRNCTKREMI